MIAQCFYQIRILMPGTYVCLKHSAEKMFTMQENRGLSPRTILTTTFLFYGAHHFCLNDAFQRLAQDICETFVRIDALSKYVPNLVF